MGPDPWFVAPDWLRRRRQRRAEERKIRAFNAEQDELRWWAERAQVVANAVITELERRPLTVNADLVLDHVGMLLGTWGRSGWMEFAGEVAKHVRQGLKDKP